MTTTTTTTFQGVDHSSTTHALPVHRSRRPRRICRGPINSRKDRCGEFEIKQRLKQRLSHKLQENEHLRPIRKLLERSKVDGQNPGRSSYHQRMNLQGATRALHEDSRQPWVPAAVPHRIHEPLYSCGSMWPRLRQSFSQTATLRLDRMTSCRRSATTRFVVNHTSEGYGDHANQDSGMFVKPWHTAQSFRSVLQQPRASGGDSDNWSGPSPDRSERLGQDTVPSSNYSAQSDCLRTHHPELLPDLPRLSFASAAFRVDPNAINLWVGDERSFNATHEGPLRKPLQSALTAARRAMRRCFPGGGSPLRRTPRAREISHALLST
jgi:Cupin-like domain